MHTIPRNSPGKKNFLRKTVSNNQSKSFSFIFNYISVYRRREVGDYPMYNTRTRDNKKRSGGLPNVYCIVKELGTITQGDWISVKWTMQYINIERPGYIFAISQFDETE